MNSTRTSSLLLTGKPFAQSGFTLIELLVSLFLGLVIIGASLSIYVSSSRGSKVSEIETRMNEEGVIALNLIQQQLKQAGYSQKVNPTTVGGVAATTMSNFAGAAVRGCDGGFSDSGLAFGSLTCAGGTGSDAIAVRYEATENNTIVTSGSPALPTNCIGNGIQETTPTMANPAPAASAGSFSYAQADNRYYVSNTAAAANERDLYCRGNQASNTMGAGQPLIANVEQMQILYGIATNPSRELGTKHDALQHQIINYVTAAEVDALPTVNAGWSAVDDKWGRVLAVRVCLLMRSTTMIRDIPTGGASYRDCSNAAQTATDGYIRRAFTTTVMLRNRIIGP